MQLRGRLPHRVTASGGQPAKANGVWRNFVTFFSRKIMTNIMNGNNRNCLQWLELEEDDDDVDEQTSEWDASKNEITIFAPTKSRRPRKLRPDTLEPVPPTPKAEPPCFVMDWMFQWLNATNTRRPTTIRIETISPLAVTNTTRIKRGDATVIDESCCSTAASSVVDDPEIAAPKSIDTTTVAIPPRQRSSQKEDRFVQQGHAKDYDYREYLTNKYRS